MHINSPSANRAPKVRACGFSLIEVTIAMGILSFALVTMLGLMPVGLNTLRGAADATTTAQIVQRISGEARLTSFENLPARFHNQEFYFDEEGGFLTNSPAAPPANVRYWAVTTVTNAVFPGCTNAMRGAPLTNSVRAISIRVISAPSYSAVGKNTNCQNLLVSDSGI